jgi:hypothetical protein
MQTPNTKIQAVAVAGALTTIVVFICVQLGLEIPAAVAGALTTLFATGLGYVVKEK